MLDQQSIDAENIDNVEREQDNEEEPTQTPNIRNDEMTSPCDAHSDILPVDSPERENVECLSVNGCDHKVSPDFHQSKPRRSQRLRKASNRLMYY